MRHSKLAKRATLFDYDNRPIAHLSYTEMDDYIRRGLVERLTPIKSAFHHFRLLIETVGGDLRISPASLPASTSMANAGACSHIGEMLWARRKVRKWPLVGDRRAVRVSCRTQKRRSRVVCGVFV